MTLLDFFILRAQQALYDGVIQPLLWLFGAMGLAERAFDASEWPAIGLCELAIMVPLLMLLEAAYPVEAVRDRRAIATDVLYSLLHRLGVVALLVFALLAPAFDALEGALRLSGFSRLNLDAVWPGVTDRPLVAFLVYLVALDFVDYWIHRAQHAWRWWWELHAVHHSQQQMTFWSDERNHLLDDVLRDAIFAAVALLIGVAPEQFVGLVVASRVLQSIQHANVRLRLPPVLARLIVGPEFHRRHHGIGVGHEGDTWGVNFGVLLPWWDQLFGTADWQDGFVATGIRDQLAGRDYGRGLLSQHWFALRRIVNPRFFGRSAEGPQER